MITVKVNLKPFLSKMESLHQNQLPFAIALALTRTAKDVEAELKREITRVFVNPKKQTIEGTYIVPAKKTNLVARIGLKDKGGRAIAVSQYLAAEIKGGIRKIKRYEKALQFIGALPPGFVTAPGAAAKMDANGNMDSKQLFQILSFFKAFPENGYRKNMSAAGRNRMMKGKRGVGGYTYFVGSPKVGAMLGIWEVSTATREIRPVLIFIKEARYKPVFKFYEVARRIAIQRFPIQFGVAWRQALASRW